MRADAGTAMTAGVAPAERSSVGATRGRRRVPLLELRAGLDPGVRVALGAGGLLVLLGAWQLAATGLGGEGFLLPTPAATAQALNELASGGELWTDLAASLRRIAIGYLISMLIGVVLGLAIGSMASVEAWWEPQIGFLRYIPASALTPLFLLWLGIDETPKVALVAVGTVFFNILMVADVARAVPLPLINAGYTLGAGRLTVLRRIILPHSLPGIIDVARINLAAAWLMLVVAELLAAQEGLAFRIIRAQRFRQVDRMFALLLVFGFIGLVSDLALRRLRNVAAPWAVSSPSSGRRR